MSTYTTFDLLILDYGGVYSFEYELGSFDIIMQSTFGKVPNSEERKKIEKRQKELLDDLQDHSASDKAFVIGASYLLDVCSRAVELFDAESTKVEQKRYLIDFILSNATLDGEKLQFTLKEPFEAVIALSKTGKWYSIIDEVRKLFVRSNAASLL